MQVRSNEDLTREGQLSLYLDDRLADAIVDAGFQRVRTTSFYAGPHGGGAFKIIDVDRPRKLLAALDRRGKGLGRVYEGLPEGRMRTNVVEMESTAAHAVSAHFATVTFLSRPHVVQIEAYALNRAKARERVDAYAQQQHELLQARAD